MTELRNARTDDPGGDVSDVRPGDVQHTTSATRWMNALLALVGTLLALVIAAPIALSSQDLVDWASSDAGLGLSRGWSLLVFVALDAAAATCVGMIVYAAWRGETAGAFGVLVWLFAWGSAVANYRHGTTTPARDDQWFFPAMSLAGPTLLEVTVRRVRRWVQTSAGRYERPLPHFRLVRWLPGIALRETASAWKLAVTEGFSRPEDAVRATRARATNSLPAPGDRGALDALNTFDALTRRVDELTRRVADRGVPAPHVPRRPGDPRGTTPVANLPTRTVRAVPDVPNGRLPARQNAELIADLREHARQHGHVTSAARRDVAERHGVSVKTVGRVERTVGLSDAEPTNGDEG